MNTRRIRREERGQALTEFALVLPLLMLILLGIIQFGIVFHNYVSVTDAVRVGARKAAVSRHASNPVSTTQSAVYAAAASLDTSKLQVTVTPPPWGPGDDVVVTATYPYQISLLGLVVKSGRFSSTTTERVE